MQHLDVGLLGTLEGDKPPPTRPRPRRPPAAATERAPGPELAETGHVGLDHQTRRGDHVRAWYRGPRSPHPTVREGAHYGPQRAGSRLRTPATSCASSSPTVAKTCRMRRHSRSGGCSRSRSRRS